MPDGDVAQHSLAPEKPRHSRAFKTPTAVGPRASADPDAALFEKIRNFRSARTDQRVEWEAVNQLPKRHPDYQSRMAALSALRPEQDRAEKQIVLTEAVTFAGAQAKAQLGYDLLADDDHEANDLLHADEGSCRMWAVALAGTRDMVRLTGGLCGDPWDSPDRKLLEAWAEFRDGMAILKAHGKWQCGSWAKHPQVADLDYAMRKLRERIITMPARTAQGRSAKAAAAVHYMAEEVADRSGDTLAKTVVRAAEAGLGNAVIRLSLPAARRSHAGEPA